jgi:hypothetical protein
MSTPEPAAAVDIFGGVCLLFAILAEVQEHGRRLAKLEQLDQARERYREKMTVSGRPRRPPGRPRGSKNRPRQNRHDLQQPA